MRQPTELGITELSEFCGLASREEDLAEFFDILALKDLTPEDALVQKISIRRAWITAKARMIETQNSAIHVVETRRSPGDFAFMQNFFTLFPIKCGNPTVPP